jgi:hypothetical protein
LLWKKVWSLPGESKPIIPGAAISSSPPGNPVIHVFSGMETGIFLYNKGNKIQQIKTSF